MSLPFVFIDFRQVLSTTVSCSDASLDGAGVMMAESLAQEGRTHVARGLSVPANTLEGRIACVESEAGIGCGRRQPGR